MSIGGKKNKKSFALLTYGFTNEHIARSVLIYFSPLLFLDKKLDFYFIKRPSEIFATSADGIVSTPDFTRDHQKAPTICTTARKKNHN